MGATDPGVSRAKDFRPRLLASFFRESSERKFEYGGHVSASSLLLFQHVNFGRGPYVPGKLPIVGVNGKVCFVFGYIL